MTQFSCIFRLDIYIHDYLVKKGMNTTAEALAREANVNPRQAGNLIFDNGPLYLSRVETDF